MVVAPTLGSGFRLSFSLPFTEVDDWTNFSKVFVFPLRNNRIPRLEHKPLTEFIFFRSQRIIAQTYPGADSPTPVVLQA